MAKKKTGNTKTKVVDSENAKGVVNVVEEDVKNTDSVVTLNGNEIFESIKLNDNSRLVFLNDVTIDKLNIEELVAYEKSASIVCGRYEVKARLSGEDNARFMEFLNYHKLIVEEMEKRVINLFKS